MSEYSVLRSTISKNRDTLRRLYNDGAEPSGNSISARNLILLSYYFGEDNYRKRAVKLFNFYSAQQRLSCELPQMLSALMTYEDGIDLIAVVGPDSPETTRLVNICRKYYIQGMIIVHINPHEPEKIINKRVLKYKMINDQPTVYICHNKVCLIPVTDPIKLKENILKYSLDKAIHV